MDEMAGPILYSANPWLAHDFASRYLGGIYFAWCSEYYDPTTAPAGSASSYIALALVLAVFLSNCDLIASGKISTAPKVNSKHKRPRVFTLTFFRQPWPQLGDRKAALALAIDLDSYREMLETRR